MNWKHWRWLNDGVLPLALITLRVCWLWLWLDLLQRGLMSSYQGGPLFPVWLIGGLLLGSTAAARWLSKFPAARARLLIAACGTAVLFLVLWWQFYRPDYPLWDWRWLRLWGQEMVYWHGEPPPSYIALPAVVYLWLRGISDGSRPLERRHVVSAFAAGCLALVAFLLAADVSQWGRAAGAANVLFLFFATAMIALALSSLKVVRIHETRPGEQLQLNRYWLVSVLTVVLALLVLALLLSLLISPAIVAQMLDWTWAILSQVLIWLIQIISLILYPILYLIARLWARLFQRPIPFGLNPLPEPELQAEPEQNNLLDTLAALPDEWRWVGLIFFILGIGLIFALVWHRFSAREKGEIEETRELIFSRELLLAQLAQLWPDWLRRLRGTPTAAFNPFLSLAGESDTRRIIREAYQSLLAATRGRGLARDHSQTPLEYRDKLTQALPAENDVLGIITGRYLQARYDSEPPPAEAAEDAQQAWQQLQKALRDRHKEK